MSLFYAVEDFQQEIGSGASFGQYFIWADKTEIDQIVDRLEVLNLKHVADVAKEAIDYAFPNGLPDDPSLLEGMTYWSEEQEVVLSKFYEIVSEYHGVITNRLGEYAVKNGLV